MSFAIQTQYVDMNTKTATFTFDEEVTDCIVGIAHVKFAYGTDDYHQHEVLRMGLSLDPTPIDKTVSVRVTPVFNDSSGHSYEASNSSILLTCLALLGTDDNAGLGLAKGITPNSRGVTLSINDGSHVFGVLSGFNYDYGSEDHYVRTISASVSADPNADEAVLTGSAELSNTSGNHASCSLDASMFAYDGVEGSGLLIESVQALQHPGGEVSVEFDREITGAGVFLQSWTAVYTGDDDHKLGAWAAGVVDFDPYVDVVVEVRPDGGYLSKVCLREPCTILADDKDGHTQDNTASNVTAIVVATLA